MRGKEAGVDVSYCFFFAILFGSSLRVRHTHRLYLLSTTSVQLQSFLSEPKHKLLSLQFEKLFIKINFINSSWTHTDPNLKEVDPTEYRKINTPTINPGKLHKHSCVGGTALLQCFRGDTHVVGVG